ncbi:MAG: hypothetical protein MK033_06320 [Candidatus Caenarcaniphilales bacterium]|nr:hypothetical protein [Candidatus Caenarcaniphilales bacterium]
MRKFDNLDDCTNELENIDEELKVAFNDDKFNVCIEKASLRSVVISQINQLRRTHKLSKKAEEKIKRSWENNQFIVDGIQNKQKVIKDRLNKRKKFMQKVRKCNYEN